MGVAHRVMTMNTVQHVPCRMFWQHGMHKVLMAIQAGTLSHAAIAIFNPDRFRKTSGRKSQRVKQAVVGLGNPFAKKIVRQMAIIATGDRMVAGFFPRAIVRLHDVTVRAGLGVVGEIGSAATVIEGEHSQPEHGAYRAGCNQRRQSMPMQLTGGRPGICVCFYCTRAAHAYVLAIRKNDCPLI